jgi:photosystem II biogenesis protein Psp29
VLNNTRTVSDTKRDFYGLHTRPINSVFRRVVEELLVEMHLLSVNVDFKYDPIYALGVVTSFDRFMQGYQPENDKASIFKALCHSVGGEAEVYRHDAEKCVNVARSCSGEQVIEYLSDPSGKGFQFLGNLLPAIANNSKFKYSRLFAIGLYTLLETADLEIFENQEKRNQIFQQISQGLNLPEGKMQKDLELYRSNLEKMEQILKAIEDAIAADRKQREKRALQQNQEAN